MARTKPPDRITLDGREYVITEIAARRLEISVWRLRELARGYSGRGGRRAISVPCQAEHGAYYFNIKDTREAIDDIRRNRDYLRGM